MSHNLSVCSPLRTAHWRPDLIAVRAAEQSAVRTACAASNQQTLDAAHICALEPTNRFAHFSAVCAALRRPDQCSLLAAKQQSDWATEFDAHVGFHWTADKHSIEPALYTAVVAAD